METFIMITKNSKINEPNRFKYDLIDKLDLKNPNKNMALGNLSIYYLIIISLKFRHQLGMIHLTCLMDRIYIRNTRLFRIRNKKTRNNW